MNWTLAFFTVFFLLIVLLVVMFCTPRARQGRSHVAGSVFWAFSGVISLTLVFVLVAVAMMVTFKTAKVAWADALPASVASSMSPTAVANLPTQSASGTPTSNSAQHSERRLKEFESTQLATKPLEDQTKDIVSNSMTAVSTAVAAVTLLLALGSAWFASKQRELQGLIDAQEDSMRDAKNELEKMRTQVENLVQRQQKHMIAQSELVLARDQLQEWVRLRATVGVSETALDYGLRLEALLSTDVQLRRRAFGQLTQFIPLHHGAALSAIARFGEACHALHARYPTAPEVGVWCKLFAAEERAYFDAEEILITPVKY